MTHYHEILAIVSEGLDFSIAFEIDSDDKKYAPVIVGN